MRRIFFFLFLKIAGKLRDDCEMISPVLAMMAAKGRNETLMPIQSIVQAECALCQHNLMSSIIIFFFAVIQFEGGDRFHVAQISVFF